MGGRLIERLRIRDLALVEELEVELGAGLNVLTGETGAGKSIVLGALSLIAGGRARPDLVRDGADTASVEASFRIEGDPGLEAALEERGLESEDGAVLVRRSVSRNGRGRAFVGGHAVPISTLAELFGERIEVSSQHASQGLLRPDVQGRALDAMGGLLDLRGQVEAGVREILEREEEIRRLREEAEERARREDFLAFQVSEIDEAGVVPGETEALSAELRRLGHAERLRDGAGLAVTLLEGDPAAPDSAGAQELLGRAARSVASLADLDPTLAPLGERAEALRSEAAELAADLERYAGGVELDPGRLAEVEERLERLDRLRRKYGDTAEEILAFRERAAGELAALGGSDERLGKLESERAAEHDRVAALAAKLSKGRAKAGRALAKAVSAGLKELAMAEARLTVELVPVNAPEGAPCGLSGAEAAELLLAANPGEPARPLRQVASGGELSRVFLALKNELRKAGPAMVLVFDEVDAGVGGRVAERVGSQLVDLSSAHQVLCISHLPQIASQGSAHYQVSKSSRGGRTRTSVSRLDAEGRVAEIARMAGGEEVTEATLEHARELLAREPGSTGERGERS